MRCIGSVTIPYLGPICSSSRWPRVLILCWLCVISLATGKASSIELGDKGHHSKLSFTYLPTKVFFDSAGDRQRFVSGGKSRFSSLSAEYRYGISPRLNLGVALPWVSSSFEDNFGSRSRAGWTDLTVIGEYRFLDFKRTRRVASLRAGVTIPTGYSTGQSRLANGTTDFVAGGTFKKFFMPRDFDHFWYEEDLAVKLALTESRANLDGEWPFPVRLGANYRPRFRYTLAGAMVGSFNDRREFLAAEGVVKIRLGTELFQGENNSAGTVYSIGFLVHSGRIWQ